jgi:hypothetical protein
MTDLAAQIRGLAEAVATESIGIESAIYEGIALVLEREPSEAMLDAAQEYRDSSVVKDYPWTSEGTYRAMTTELLRELREGA